MNTTNYNPDVLSCLANLSNDEVFTPPGLANDMLDLLPAALWRNPNATFLDPVSKSGVFLREIAKRLDKGLETHIPDKQKRINHIFTKQIFGIAITELTSLLSRRTVYGSKFANGTYSFCEAFETEQGNLAYQKMQHTWAQGRCTFCGANQGGYNRQDAQENYAYPFIHTHNPETFFDMKFDVIIGNPPYQLGADGGNRDIPIYNKFVEQAKKLNPKFLCMIIPSRWMAGGLGLSDFRKEMLSDKRLCTMVDFPAANEVFLGVEIKGGVCYFLLDRDYNGNCKVSTIRNGEQAGPFERNLGEYDVFVREEKAVKILKKILAFNEPSITEILSVDKEFGWTSNFSDFNLKKTSDDIAIYYIKNGKRNIGWINRRKVLKSTNLIDRWKVFIPKAGSDGGKKIPDIVLGKPLIGVYPAVCTQSYLFFYVDSENEANSIESYYRTKFFRFLVSLRKITQDATRNTYKWVPQQNWNLKWNDDMLFKKYKLSKDEIAFIESMIRPMDASNSEQDDA